MGDKVNTGLGPEKTSFFQALAIPTKITKGTIEILSDIHLIKKGEKVGASEATLLGMLKIYPFHYGLVCKTVYDNGSIYSPDILDIKPEDLISTFLSGISNVASVCLEADIDIPQIQAIKEYLADPSKFAAAAPAAATEEEKPAEADKKEESEEESDEDMGFGLFD